MKILVLSDSHGNVDAMKQVVERERPDEILHLGDCVRDAEALRSCGIPLTLVPGNCDYRPNLPDILTLQREGIRIYMTHGHLHSVKIQYQRILYAALEAEAQVVLFGHTHRPECFYERGLWVLNPGACNACGTYGLVTLSDGTIRCDVKSVRSHD